MEEQKPIVVANNEADSRQTAEVMPVQPVPGPNDLERLRDILYGSQARSTDKRLEDLELRVEQLRNELTEILYERVNGVAAGSYDQVTAVRKELGERLTALEDNHSVQLRQNEQRLVAQIESLSDRQNSQLRTVQRDLTVRLDKQEGDYVSQLRKIQQEMEDRFEELTATFLNQVRQTYSELSGQIEHLRQEKSDQISALQSETRRRNENLHQELIASTGGLDHKKLSRQQLAQLFVEVAQRLNNED